MVHMEISPDGLWRFSPCERVDGDAHEQAKIIRNGQYFPLFLGKTGL